MLRLFKILEDEIISTTKILPDEVILVFDEETKNLYVYRGEYSPKIDEFRADRLYERIINRFLNPNIYYLQSIIESREDPEIITRVKHFIFDHYPNLRHYSFQRTLQNIFLLKDLRIRLKSFRNYEKSREWRTNLSNLTNIWKLSVFNILSILSVFGILIYKLIIDINRSDFIFINPDRTLDPVLWSLWLQDLALTIIICGLILGGVIILNLLFVLFPLRFPINPENIQAMSKTERKTLQLPEMSAAVPVPKLPPAKTSSDKAGLPQIKIQLGAGQIGKTPTEQEKFEEEDMSAPSVPLKKKMSIPVLGNAKDLEELAKKDTPTIKFVISDCEICKKNVIVPVTRKLIESSKEPVTDISFLHGNPQHILVLQLDRDFQVRRRRVSPVVFEEK
jgi:hypothetical protein